MEVRFYNSDMNFIGLMENQQSMVWRRKFYEPGENSKEAEIRKRLNAMWKKYNY